MQRLKTRTIAWIAGLAVTLAAGAMFAINSAYAQDKKPIKIGFGMSLTGFLSPNGKQALLGMKIWEEQTNKAGGLLGRPVKLVYYDDKSSPAEIPGIYTKLLDVDKVDLVLSAYATNDVAPAMPIVIRKGKTFISLFALDVNAKFNYPKYFSMLPTGPDTKASFTEGFFEIAAAQKPKPTDGGAAATPTPSSRRTPAKARAPTPRSTASRSSTTRAIRRRRRPPISRRSCARSRRPMPTSSWCAPIRSTRSAWCRRPTKSA